MNYLQGQRVAEITQKLISAIDVMQLQFKSVDQLAPYIRDIHVALNGFPNLPANFRGLATIKKWIDFFQGKQATDELSEQECRQLQYDLENVMNQFNEEVLGAKR